MGPQEPTQQHEGAGRSLSQFVRDERNAILADWEKITQTLPIARTLDHTALLNHLPWLLDRIATMVEEAEQGREVESAVEEAALHALERLDEGYDLDSVVREFALLREVILERWQQLGRAPSGEAILNRAIDQAISTSVSRYVRTRDRTLVALDRISSAALESTNLDTFLSSLGRVLLATMPAVDSLAIFLLESDGLLHLRAGMGLEEELSGKLTMRLGEGCAGTIAATKKPLELREAAKSPLVTESLRSKGARAFYGVPMMNHAGVLGVAHISSRTAYEFSNEDKVLFRAMVERATLLVVQAQLILREQQARAEAERISAQLDALLASAPVGLEFFDRDFRFLRVNAPVAAAGGRSIEGWVGRTLEEVKPPFASRFEAELRRVIETGEPLLGAEASMTSPDGRQREWLVNYFPVRTRSGEIFGAGGILVEITSQKQTERELQSALDALARAAREFQALAEAMPAIIWTAQPDGNVDYVNKYFTDLTGLPPPSCLGFGWMAAIHPDDVERVTALWTEAIERAEPYLNQQRYRRKDGTYRWFQVRAIPMRDAEGRVQKWFGANLDIDELKRVETELKRQTESAQQLIGIVSHDLRNPISAILLGAQALLRGEGLDERRLRGIARLISSAERAHRMVRDLLDFTQARLRGGIPIERGPLNLHHLVRHVIEEVQAANPERQFEVIRTGDGNGEWDGDRLAQVITNLVTNALNYSPRDSQVRVEAIGNGESVQLRVHNEGPPISPEVLPRIFEPLERGDQAGEVGGRNIGLGLFIVDQIVRAHGGNVEVTSTEKEGTTFTVRLPRRAPQVGQDQHQAASQPEPQA